MARELLFNSRAGSRRRAIEAVFACAAIAAALATGSCHQPSGPSAGAGDDQPALPVANIEDKTWWGRWLRLDLQEEWYIASAAVTRGGSLAAVRSWDGGAGIARLDGLALSRQSENVISANGGQFYLFRKSGARGSLSGLVAATSAGASRILAMPGVAGVQIAIANVLNPANASVADVAADGSFSFGDIVPYDTYSVQTLVAKADGSTAAGPGLSVVPRIDAEDIGAITLADLPYNFKVSGEADDAAANLVADGSPKAVTISVRNIGSGSSLEGASFSFPGQSGVSVSSTADPILGTIVPGGAKSIAASVSCDPITAEYADRDVAIRIADANGNVWSDSARFRFYRASMTVSILSLDHPVNGVILTPEKEGVWFRTQLQAGSAYAATVTVPYRERGYLLCLSGASLDTETRYSVGFDAPPESESGLRALGDTAVYEPNGSETAAWPIGLGQSIAAYLHSGDVDFYGIGLKAAKPVLSPAGGAFLSPQLVSISCATSGATIYYSTGGADPRIGGIRYDGPFAVVPPATVKAIALKSGWGDSEITLVSFLEKAAAPTIGPSPGDYEDPFLVTLATPTPGAAILYALGGADPSGSGAVAYSGPFLLTPPAALRAIARKAGFGDSDSASASYILRVKPPAISPPAGAYAESLFNVSLTSPTAGAAILCTTDGSDPADRSNPAAFAYSGPFQVAPPVSVRAVCAKAGCADSYESSASYQPRAQAPLVSPPDGTYGSNGIMVTLSSPTAGCEIRYTTDGSDPGSSSPIYSAAFAVPGAQTVVKAYAAKAGMADSARSIAVYNPTIRMKAVDGASFQMGSTSSSDNGASPVHEVAVSGFMMGVYEIRQSDYLARMGTNPSINGGTGKESYPVENVSWLDAVAFCNALSQSQGLEAVYEISGGEVQADFSKEGYRLPTEAEWEFAARGGSANSTTAYSGSSTASTVAWYDSNSSNATHAVGGKAGNALVLYDMSGNAWEWCWDWYADYPAAAAVDPRGPATGTDRVMRGGDFKNTVTKCRVSYRGFNLPDFSSNGTGFRIARRMGAGTGTGGYAIVIIDGRDKTGTGNTGGGLPILPP